jgi:hypothetical protein
MVETTRSFILELATADSVYLLFTLEEINFWEMLEQDLPESYYTGKVRINDFLWLEFVPQATRKPPIGYQVDSIDWQRVLELTADLEPVETAKVISSKK